MTPDFPERYPSQAAREALASRLGLTIDPHSQDWEWEVAEPKHFSQWLEVYHDLTLTDDARFSLMEMLVQCVEELGRRCGSEEEVERLPEWQAVAGLLRANSARHASTIRYWSVFGADEPEHRFSVSVPMRRVWAEAAERLSD
jgi:hypothetical protein